MTARPRRSTNGCRWTTAPSGPKTWPRRWSGSTRSAPGRETRSSSGGLPVPAMYDIVERAPVGILDRGQRPVRRVAERDQQRPVAVVRDAQQLAHPGQVRDPRVAAADPEIRGGEHHRHRGLAKVELGPAEWVVASRADDHDRCGRVRHVAGAPEDLRQLDEQLTVDD